MPIHIIEDAKKCQHGQYRHVKNLHATFFVLEKEKGYAKCCNENMEYVYLTEEAAGISDRDNKIMMCLCCGKAYAANGDIFNA